MVAREALQHIRAKEPVTLKALANVSSGLRGLRLTNADATHSELRLLDKIRFPRVAEAQPWAGIG